MKRDETWHCVEEECDLFIVLKRKLQIPFSKNNLDFKSKKVAIVVKINAVALQFLPGIKTFYTDHKKSIIVNSHYKSKVFMTNVTKVGYTFAVESNSNANVRGVINNNDLTDKKYISMNKIETGVQAIITNDQK